jgi:hypothetical protein
MKTPRFVASAALLGSLLSYPVQAAIAPIELHPLPRTEIPVPTKIVNPLGVPAQYEDAIIKLSFTVDTAGVPRDIRVQDVADPALTDSLVSALVQWRFNPGRRDGVAVSMNVVLPLELSRKTMIARSDREVGAVPVATRRNGRPVSRADLDAHESLLHVNVATLDGQHFVSDGMSEAEVRTALGEPQAIVGNVWSYDHYDAESRDAARHGCNTLLIAFSNHRVTTLALVNDHARRFAAKQLQFEPGYLDRILQDMHEATIVAQR